MSTFIAKNALLTLAVLLAAADPCLAADGGPVGLSVRTFAVLIGAIAGLFALAWAAKKYGPYARVRRSIGLDIIGQVPVGARANLALVRVGRSVLLIGVTQNTVTLIKDLEQGDFEKTIQEAGA
ncbi:MAG: flagellar biosynthesis protein FliO [Deltaproteobacteria bacterium ADurb.BinA179]|jgi:flagellar biosynthetic protein FliO|nr:flagellar biosynthetic protein FliO [Deltaproteobacteria bacterium]MDI9541555.1 flagellar biosynthetic protein FliO [Pseudomonadota bacterium]OPZ29828.1 MAG: flagellar biosynthesis protein FliO [Deltaproteobacteria bacterium ADurb.BinA179]HNR50580.1 flagellar biosynthetic protein FliO [Deltaproteobacteria bacterium]HOD71717.1 flagellar biosynthetic protein FliO [Deltaproteobacteria bacterium]